MENRLHDPVISSVGRRRHVGPRLQTKTVLVYRRRRRQAATPLHVAPDQGNKFARFQNQPDCKRLQPHTRHLEKRVDYHSRTLETRVVTGLRRLKVLNIEPLQTIMDDGQFFQILQ